VVAAADIAMVPADADEAVAIVNVAMSGAAGAESDGGVRILGDRAFS
jgi:hypothetical protein